MNVAQQAALTPGTQWWCPNNADTHARVWETSGWRLPSPSAVISHWDVQERHTALTTKCFQTVILPGQIVVFFPVHVRLSFHVKKTHQNFWVIYFKPQPDLRPLFKAIFWGHFPYFSPHHLGTLPNRREFGPYNFPSFFWNPWLGKLLGCPKEVRKGLVCGL